MKLTVDPAVSDVHFVRFPVDADTLKSDNVDLSCERART
ncbi:MAG: hypothetical protein FD129_1807 [bacterium]|nr:MAG: hypothetical protein FD129_1807 [bacterium]